MCDSNNHIQDVLVVSYLANTIRTQIDLANRLATAALTLGTGEGNVGQNENKGSEGGQRNQAPRRNQQNRDGLAMR